MNRMIVMGNPTLTKYLTNQISVSWHSDADKPTDFNGQTMIGTNSKQTVTRWLWHNHRQAMDRHGKTVIAIDQQTDP